MNITPTSLTINQLLGSTKEQYVVPPYQRRYSWHEKQLWDLVDDIRFLEDADTHLLGSIVCLTEHHTAGINQLELVDGQQRLTTVAILLHCILERLRRESDQTEAQEVERLLQAKAPSGVPARKIALDSLDASEFEELAAGGTIEKPANPRLAAAFGEFRKWLAPLTREEVATFLYRLQNNAVIVRLDVGRAKDAFKLFETINNRGLKLSVADIIKNFILGNAARFSPSHLELARKRWAELVRYLDGTNLESFFRHYLSAHFGTRITRSYVVDQFKAMFIREVQEANQLPDRHSFHEEDPAEEGFDEDGDETPDEAEADLEIDRPIETAHAVSFAQFLDHLVSSAKAYGQIVLGKTGNAEIDRHLRNLRLIKSLQSHGFLTALRVGGCSEENFVQILQLTEAFLLRRHICRERSNETERLFARLSRVDCSDPAPVVVDAYRELCPSDDRFREEFAVADFVPALVDRARYCLERFELNAQGKHLELLVGGSDLVHVEHIIPQKIKTKKAKDEFGDWPEYLGFNAEDRHRKLVARIGNLTLFAGALNIGASNNPYRRKKDAYLQSAIKITNSLPDEYKEFRFAQLEKRSAALAERAVKLWPFP